MRVPSLKSWLIFGAGFATFPVFLAALVGLLYVVVVAPRQVALEKEAQAVLREHGPDFSPIPPQPAFFDFMAVGKDSKPLDFRDYRGRVIVLNIWATWCGPCMDELPSLGELATHYAADTNVAVFCVSEEPAQTIFKDKKALATGAPLYSLDGKPLPDAYAVKDGIPVTFVIDRQGTIVCRHLGTANWAHPSAIKFIDALRR